MDNVRSIAPCQDWFAVFHEGETAQIHPVVGWLVIDGEVEFSDEIGAAVRVNDGSLMVIHNSHGNLLGFAHVSEIPTVAEEYGLKLSDKLPLGIKRWWVPDLAGSPTAQNESTATGEHAADNG